MSIILTGGAGFIGSHLCAHFTKQKERVLVLDNLSRGKEEYLRYQTDQNYIDFQKIDIANIPLTALVVKEFHQQYPVDMVWHMAANSDIPAGTKRPSVDFNDTFVTTFSILEAIRPLGIKKFTFASSDAVYGDHGPEKKLTENTGPLLPISYYGAMKLASEALLSASAESYLERVWIFRFPNVVGTPATHGVIFDFINKLKVTPDRLEVLGDGSQKKLYIHIDELLEAMIFIVSNSNEKMNVFNIGPDDSGCSVTQIAESTVEIVSPKATIAYGTEPRGWVGDIPKFLYSVDKLSSLGWRSKSSSIEAVRKAIVEIFKQELGNDKI
ncbi:MAG: NAD-dependent epimerase/dehydratase family protein [Deltaproteobacteria bacterium]|jgi:UDP-glucose 4-epimerase|nr:NAD-dependent epimerase/dehydratase family protein [Deltaproteobacteria bacterium]